MANRSWDYRKHKRFVKGTRRIKQDRMEHGNDRSCDCFCPDIDKGRGATFARFADTPKYCNHWMCSSEAEAAWGEKHFEPTLKTEEKDQ